jgi:ferredoxin
LRSSGPGPARARAGAYPAGFSSPPSGAAASAKRRCSPARPCPLHAAWADLRARILELLEERSLADLLAVDRELSDRPISGAAYGRRRRRIEWLRHSAQVVLFAVVVAIGWQFVRWVDGLEAGRRVRSPECVGCLSCVAACPVNRALQVEAPRRLRLRPAVAAALLVALFFGGIGWARWSGHWHTSVSDREYLQRIHALDGPEYEHIR